MLMTSHLYFPRHLFLSFGLSYAVWWSVDFMVVFCVQRGAPVPFCSTQECVVIWNKTHTHRRIGKLHKGFDILCTSVQPPPIRYCGMRQVAKYFSFFFFFFILDIVASVLFICKRPSANGEGRMIYESSTRP